LNRRSNLVRYLTLLSFLPPALITVYAAMIGRDALAVAGMLWLIGTGALLWWMDRWAG